MDWYLDGPKQENNGSIFFYIARVRHNKTWRTGRLYRYSMGLRWKNSWEGLLVVTDVTTTWAKVIFRVKCYRCSNYIFINVWARRKMHSVLSGFPSQYPWYHLCNLGNGKFHHMGNKSSASLLRVRHFSNFLCNFCMYCWIIYLHMVHLLWSRRLTSLLGSKETFFLSRRQKTRCDKPKFKLAKTKAI